MTVNTVGSWKPRIHLHNVGQKEQAGGCLRTSGRAVDPGKYINHLLRLEEDARGSCFNSAIASMRFTASLLRSGNLMATRHVVFQIWNEIEIGLPRHGSINHQHNQEHGRVKLVVRHLETLRKCLF